MKRTQYPTFTDKNDRIPCSEGMLDFNCDLFMISIEQITHQTEQTHLLYEDSSELIHYFRYGE